MHIETQSFCVYLNIIIGKILFQSCPIEIGAWAYKSSRMNLTNVDSKVETAEFKLNGEWVITSTKADWHEVGVALFLVCVGMKDGERKSEIAE